MECSVGVGNLGVGRILGNAGMRNGMKRKFPSGISLWNGKKRRIPLWNGMKKRKIPSGMSLWNGMRMKFHSGMGWDEEENSPLEWDEISVWNGMKRNFPSGM